ncbi:hypothetical protein GCM10007874_31240 [Labrys miyagiensis]|uniref:Uncharacterized protein n=1 Tax=Labrys miyagiensis TaxID=346912 RepID=A0ABQ6CKF1_9HYPH|nr:hypothetical protein GCM10007874_31240 [Labrys miyagiensis]
MCEIAGPGVSKVVLQASPEHETPEFSALEGAEHNLPLVAAYAMRDSAGRVFDGPLLTAVRSTRNEEVRMLPDEAAKSRKVYIYNGRARFTASLGPEDAFAALAAFGPLQPFTEATRPLYFKLLSSLAESTNLRLS